MNDLPNLTDYKKYVLKNEGVIGRVHKNESDTIIEKTWWNDIGARVAYIYDYYADDQQDNVKGFDPKESTTKTKINIKFQTQQSASLSKDQVAYLVQFMPSQENPLDYYDERMGKYFAEFPIGCYIDIPDEKNVYRKWLICDISLDQQFIKYEVLPCNYRFMWIDRTDGEPIKRKMWGVARLRNSYNSGIWTDYKFTTVENQDQMWLPMNDISSKLFYNQRLIVSAPIKEPITWQITKPENLHPFGINKLTLYQTKFDINNDYINYETGEMFADYYSSGVSPVNETTQNNSPYVEIINSSISNELKIFGSKKTLTSTIHYLDGSVDNINAEWEFSIDGEIIGLTDNRIKIEQDTNYSYKISAISNSVINKVLKVKISCDYNGTELTDELGMYIGSL